MAALYFNPVFAIMSFSVNQPKFLDYLKDGNVVDGQFLPGEDWFCTAIFNVFADIAQKKGCTMQPSKRRLKEARALWMNEIANMKIERGGEPDHFKQAGFLAYWLRRRVVISLTHESVVDGYVGSPEQVQFVLRPNEICSFLLGFRICVFFEATKKTGKAREEYLQSIELNPDLVNEMSVLFYEKQLSPHAMYLIYKSLFYRLILSDPDNVVPLRVVGPSS